MIYNFNLPRNCGKTYYEMNKGWKDLKARVKQILDDKNSCRENKIDLIIALLENYKHTFLISKGEDKK